MKFHVIACWLVLAASSAQAATVQVFFDRQAFEAAAGPLTVEDFNDFTADASFGAASGVLQPLQVGPFSLSSDRGGNANRVDAQVNGSGAPNLDSNRVDETPFVRVQETAGNNDFFIDFDDPIFAFGTDVASYSNRQTDILLSFGIEPAFRLDGDDAANEIIDFVGFVTDVAFSQIAVVRDGGDNTFGLDNFAFSTTNSLTGVTSTTAVPLPAALPVFLIGLGVFGAYARSRRVSR